MKKYITLIVFIISATLTSSAMVARKPLWVKQRPNEASNYMGIGMAQKNAGENNYATLARNMAMKELCGEIKITISSNSLLHQFENNYALKEEFESSVQTSVAQTLEGYEVETWEDKSQYWVKITLSKDKYLLNKRLALDKARKTALMLIETARKAVDQSDINTALVNYINAIQAIESHLDEDLTVKTFDGDINIGTAIYGDIQTLFRRISLNAEQNRYAIVFSQQLRIPVKVKATIGNGGEEPVNLMGLPIEFKFTNTSNQPTNKATTDGAGVAICNIGKLESKRRVQELTAAIDIESMINEMIKSRSLINSFIPPSSIPHTLITIELSKSTAYIESTENTFNIASMADFNNRIKGKLADNYFMFTNNKDSADYIITLQSEFTQGSEKQGSGYSVFIVYGSYRIAILNNKQQLEVFSDGVDRMVGMQPGDYDHALKNCREKLENHFNSTTMKKLDIVDM